MSSGVYRQSAEAGTRDNDFHIVDSRVTPYCINGHFAYPPHEHGKYFDLIYMVEGQRHDIVNGEPRILRPGDLLWIREGDWHECSGKSVRYFNLYGKNTWLESAFNFLQFTEAYQTLLKFPNPPFCNIPPKDRKMIAAAWERCREVDETRLGHGYVISLLSRMFIDYFFPQVEWTMKRSLYPDWFYKAIDYIHNHVGEKITPEDLFQVCNRSPEHISRSFRNYLQATPTDYINLTRLNHAAHLLGATNLPILEISMKVGFNHLGYFYRLFKKRFNMPPRIYRQRRRAREKAWDARRSPKIRKCP